MRPSFEAPLRSHLRVTAEHAAAVWELSQIAAIISSHEEIRHGTKIFEESLQRRRAGDEEAQSRDVAKRSLEKESREPQASDRDRVVRGARKGQEGAEEGLAEAQYGQ